MANKVTIKLPNGKDSVQTDSATISGNIVFDDKIFLDPERPKNPSEIKLIREDENQKVEEEIYKWYKYKNLQYIWNIHNQRETTLDKILNNYLINNLIIGQTNSINANIQIQGTRYQITQSRSKITNKQNGSIQYGNFGEEEEELDKDISQKPNPEIIETLISNTLYIYTHPGNFTSWNSIKQGAIIQKVLTADNVSKWCVHCGKYLSWRDQSNRYNDADECKVTSNSIITAKWYNDCSKLCGCDSIVNKDDLICASQFISLANCISLS